MDAFLLPVEERDHPELVGHPLVIARHPRYWGKGVVTTANYIARQQYGIHWL